MHTGIDDSEEDESFNSKNNLKRWQQQHLSPAHSQRAAEEWAATHVLAGATAYCQVCRRVCWLARSPSAQAALMQHTALLETLAATHSHSFSSDSSLG